MAGINAYADGMPLREPGPQTEMVGALMAFIGALTALEEREHSGLGQTVDAKTKAAKLRELRDALGLARDQTIAIGDGANDLAMMAEAGVSIAYHAKPVVREKATYCFDYVGLDGLLNLYT